MITDNQTLIEQRPHLKDPLELYDRWQKFQIEAARLLSDEERNPLSTGSESLQRESVWPVFQLFVSAFDLSGEELEPLGRALQAGEIDFMRFPLDEIPDLSLPSDKNDLEMILFLFSRPYFLALREACLLDGDQWTDGRCPLCSARPALASITEGPKRILHCSWCGTAGPYRFIGCPNCGTEDTSKLGTLMSDDEPGYRVSTCDECRTYVKIVEGSVLGEMTADQADLACLPLDIVAQEKNYLRRAPNPIGLKKMV